MLIPFWKYFRTLIRNLLEGILDRKMGMKDHEMVDTSLEMEDSRKVACAWEVEDRVILA